MTSAHGRRQPKDDGISLLTDLLAPYAAAGQTIGVMKDMKHTWMPLSDWERLQASLRAQDRRRHPLVQGLRMVKSDAEMAKLRPLCHWPQHLPCPTLWLKECH